MLLIFDIDGTLFEGHRATVPAVLQAFQQFGLPLPDPDEVTNLIGTSAIDYETWLKARCDGADPEAVLAETNRYELEHVRTTATLYPGVTELLVELKAAGHSIATATNAPRDYFDAVLDAHGLRDFIDIPFCKGDGFASKTAMVARAMATCRDRPAVVIGDRRDDVEAAHANGALAIGAAYGYGREGELEAADTIIFALSGLKYVLP